MSQPVRQNHPVARHLQMLDAKMGVVANATKLTKFQVLIALLYPIVILVGQLVWLASPQETTHNYFTSKKNIFNVLFVKKGWLWTSVVYLLLLLRVPSTSRYFSADSLADSLKQFACVTLCWYFYTQWFFGLPIMDKIFVLTGGSCDNIPQSRATDPLKFKLMDASNLDLYYSSSLTSSQCRAIKGRWTGGHDPSGHMFILSLSSMFLILECARFYTLDDLATEIRNFKNEWRAFWRTRDTASLRRLLKDYPLVFISLLLWLWFWMIFVTSASSSVT
ncbi:uncharacterized protein OGAPODRAFT_93818 [Ogataea polymorpha]|uniref:uncharacterized protein n=1 Tax=Ogataea polymorpha TaxID=460523 RepID=UPI0007F45602|nr:uncharacterized protein OGAPODRAFT_93818 [Ogataea polymorpha]OBA16884.1 hypothetical protein OGAPODRAFT_93818 [Ogataea polymorpha]